MTAVSLFTAVVFKSNINWCDIQNCCFDWSLTKEIIYDVAIGVFSSMILVWFIDGIAEHLQKKAAEKEAKETIIRFNLLFRKYLDRYITMFYCVTTPASKRNASEDKHKVFQNKDTFALAEMCDLHKPSLIIEEGIAISSIQAFLKIELAVRHQIEAFLLNNQRDPKFQEIYEILEAFIATSISYDFSTTILSNQSISAGKQNSSDDILLLLKNTGDKYYSDLKAGKDNKNNKMYPYILLREFMQKERKILLNYQKRIEEMR